MGTRKSTNGRHLPETGQSKWPTSVRQVPGGRRTTIFYGCGNAPSANRGWIDPDDGTLFPALTPAPVLPTKVGLERVMGIEPTWPAWKAGALPLSYTRTQS